MRIARRERIHCSCGSFIRANGKQRVAIWWRTHDGLSSDIAAGTRPVLNDELLTELLGEPLTYHARDDVNRLARGKSDDDAHWPRRIALRSRDARDSRENGGAHCQMQKISAGKFHRRQSRFDVFIRSPRRRGRAASA